jgi:hypothetical protein
MTHINIAAFGALNKDSYDAFSYWMDHYAKSIDGLDYTIHGAGPYPNARAESEPGRPLRGEALQNDGLKDDLLKAVADDATSLGDSFDYYCMPCLSMVGFQDGIEAKLGRNIVRLADGLKSFYQDIDKVGVINMRPAQKRIAEIFGDKAVIPSQERLDQLVEAEAVLKETASPAAIESAMLEITEDFKAQGLKHVLFARADVPKAQMNLDDKISDIQVNSYFQVLAYQIVQDASVSVAA